MSGSEDLGADGVMATRPMMRRHPSWVVQRVQATSVERPVCSMWSRDSAISRHCSGGGQGFRFVVDLGLGLEKDGKKERWQWGGGFIAGCLAGGGRVTRGRARSTARGAPVHAQGSCPS
jgi:hypothetical protein